MAGGKGTRLKPLTCSIPKPMVPIMNKPNMEYTIELLKNYGITDIAVTLAHLPNNIIDYFNTGKKWDVNLNYFIEDTPLGTGGSVKNAEEFINSTILVLSGDALTDLNIKEAIEYHNEKKSKVTLILKRIDIPLEYGVVITDAEGKITQFVEKPSWGEVFSNTINTGMYLLEPEVLEYYKKGENFDFSKDLFPKLLKDNIPMYGYITDNYWNDIGSLSSYVQTHLDILDGKLNKNIINLNLSDGMYIGKDTKITGEVAINPPVFIGHNCLIKEGSIIGPYVVLGNNTTINNDVSLKKSILWNNSYLGKGTHLTGSVISNNVKTKNYVEIYENAVIGEECVLGDRVIVKPDIKIWPCKKIQENTIVNQNLVWGTKASKNLFGFKDICGQINVEISPEFASRLGTAFASSLMEDSTIIISSDSYNSSGIIKNALISGILSTGIGVIDVQNLILPANRLAVTEFRASGGIHIRKDFSNDDLVHIEFMDEKGVNISRAAEREIENLFNREDFKRCNADQIKSIIEIKNYINHFFDIGKNMLKHVNEIKRKNLNIVVKSKCKDMQRLAVDYLERIGCNSYEDYTSFNNYMELKQLVLEKKADMGIVVSEDGEKIILIDGKGRVIDQERYEGLALLIILKQGNTKKIVLPYITPSSIEKIAEDYNVEVLHVKSNPSNIMSAMIGMQHQEKAQLSQYILSYNAIWSMGVIVDFLIKKALKLENLVDEIPQIHFIKNKIPCEIKDKGRIIRQIFEDNENEDVELSEGIKITSEKGWTLILPDSEKSLFNVYTEGVSAEYAEELSTFYHDKIEKLLNTKENS